MFPHRRHCRAGSDGDGDAGAVRPRHERAVSGHTGRKLVAGVHSRVPVLGCLPLLEPCPEEHAAGNCGRRHATDASQADCELEAVAVSSEARPLPRDPARTMHPRRNRPDRAMPSSSNSSSLTGYPPRTTSAQRRSRAPGSTQQSPWTAGTTPPTSPTNTGCGTNCARCDSSSPATTPSSWAPSASARPSSQRRSVSADRRRFTVDFERCDRLVKRLAPPGSTTATTSRCAASSGSTCSIIDDFALQALDTLDTADIYELIVERHRAAATVATSDREPIEWLALMADPLLAQSAID